MKLDLTKDEANALAGLLDIAVKAGGLQVAEGALAIFRKVQAAAATPEPEPDAAD